MPSQKHILACWLAGLLLVQQHACAWAQFTKDPPHQQSHAFDNYISLLAAANLPKISAYHDTHSYSPALPTVLVKNGLVSAGANSRLRRVMAKLLDGGPVNVGVIGGSVSFGHGVQRGTKDWFSLFSKYLQTAFPKAAVTARNGCVPGTQTEYVSSCLQQFVSPDVDLIFVEFATNDGYLDTSVNNGHTHAFERLIRKLLKFPNNPAVVVMNFLHSDVMNSKLLFFRTIEDHYGVVAQYYQLPWLSVRDAVWQGLVNGWEGFRVEEIFTGSEQHGRHPNELGHHYMADLAVGLIQQVFREIMLQPFKRSDDVWQERIPAPLFPGNYEPSGSTCSIGIDFKAAAAGNHTGWFFVNEGSVMHQKWGYVSHTPGSLLVLQLDTTTTSMQPIPQLTLPQKIQLLQRHGMFAAAAELQQPAAQFAQSLAAIIATQMPAGAVEAADGLQAALQVAELQAKAVALAMQGGVGAFSSSGGERLVGGAGTAGVLLLPPEDMQTHGTSKTTTGVEVVLNMPTAGRHLLAGSAAPSPTAPVSSMTPTVPGKGLGSSIAASLSQVRAWAVQHVSSMLRSRPHSGVQDVSGQQQHGAVSSSSSSSMGLSAAWGCQQQQHGAVSSSSSSSFGGDQGTTGRALQGVLPPNAEPVPHDAVHLRPAKHTAGSAGNTARNSSNWGHTDKLVWIAYHKSHSRLMGMAKISCLSGCTCKETVIDAWISHKTATSKTVMAKLQVTQHPQCRIGLEVLQQSSTGHHQVKVTGIMLSKVVDYTGDDVDEQGSGVINAIEQAMTTAPGFAGGGLAG